MKLLFTIHQFFPEHSSGTEILTFQVAKELQSHGHEVHVLTGYPAKVPMDESERFDSYTYEGINVSRFYHASVPLGQQNNIMEAEYNNLFFAAYFRKFISENKPDIVHFFHLSRLSASPVGVCVDLEIPTVMTTTDFWPICPTSQLRLPDSSLCNGPDASGVNCLRHVVEISQTPENHNKLKAFPNWLVALGIWSIKHKLFPEEWFTPYVRALANRPEFLKNHMNQIDRILVPTRLMQSILQKHGLQPQRVLFMPFGIDTKTICRGSNKGAMKQLRVGFIGTLFEHKGTHLLIEAVQSLLPDIPVELKIYGKLEEFPAYASKLYQTAKSDPRIIFCGTFPNNNIGKIFLDLDVLVVPSIWYENTPLVIYSAQAAGCPIIATNVGGMSEVVHHEINGLLFERGSVIELAKSLRRLYEDRVLLSRLAENSVSSKSVQEYATELESIYEMVLLQKRGKYQPDKKKLISSNCLSTDNENYKLENKPNLLLKLNNILKITKVTKFLWQSLVKYLWRKFFLESNSGKWVDRATANKLMAESNKAFRDIHFGNEFTLLGVITKSTNDGLRLELFWESLNEQSLMYINFVHLVNSEGSILNQADYPQDDLKRVVNKGKLWRDIVQIPSEKLTGAKAIGLGIHVPSGTPLSINYGSTDWDGKRLLININ